MEKKWILLIALLLVAIFGILFTGEKQAEITLPHSGERINLTITNQTSTQWASYLAGEAKDDLRNITYKYGTTKGGTQMFVYYSDKYREYNYTREVGKGEFYICIRGTCDFKMEWLHATVCLSNGTHYNISKIDNETINTSGVGCPI